MRYLYFILLFLSVHLFSFNTLYTSGLEKYEVGAEFTDCPMCPTMVVVKGGSFMFGSPDNEPLRMVVEEGPQYNENVKSLAVGKTEVTIGQWESCIEDGFCQNAEKISYEKEDENLPITDISWIQIHEKNGFLDWLNKHDEKHRYRLPTETEWEYFARAGNEFPFPRKYEITSEEANFRGTTKYIGKPASIYRGHVIEIASFEPNDFGIYDVQGNVLEWTSDCWYETLEYYKLKKNPMCDRKGLRGGSWLDEPNSLRFAFRRGYPQSVKTKNIGFRVVKELSTEPLLPPQDLSTFSMPFQSNIFFELSDPLIDQSSEYATNQIKEIMIQLNDLGKLGCKSSNSNDFFLNFKNCNAKVLELY